MVATIFVRRTWRAGRGASSPVTGSAWPTSTSRPIGQTWLGGASSPAVVRSMESSMRRLIPPMSRHRPVSHRYPRSARVNEVLREVVADALEKLMDEEGEHLRLVTITAVECDPDFRHAVVLYATLGDENDAVTTLERLRVDMQAAIAREVRLKRTPLLAFRLDPAIITGQRIEDVLRESPRPPHQEEADLASRYRWDSKDESDDDGPEEEDDEAGGPASAGPAEAAVTVEPEVDRAL